MDIIIASIKIDLKNRKNIKKFYIKCWVDEIFFLIYSFFERG